MHGRWNILYVMYGGVFVLCMWSSHSEFMVLFVVCNLWINPGFIF